ncbi:MAG: KEOPS complex subunit Cgi121 [Methanobrevibacter sp.]|nr:KEOPS complex subunit Cgi121 [Methanobrevibacter sp.]
MNNYDLAILDNVEIAGFKGNIDNINQTLKAIDKIQNSCCDGTVIQLMDAKAIGGEKHLIHSIIHGINAFKRGENLANDIGIEICLRASATRQISKALDIIGLKEGEMDICALLIDCPDYYIDELEGLFKRDDSVIAPNPKILKDIYNVTDEELSVFHNITDILIDRTSSLIINI